MWHSTRSQRSLSEKLERILLKGGWSGDRGRGVGGEKKRKSQRNPRTFLALLFCFCFVCLREKSLETSPRIRRNTRKRIAKRKAPGTGESFRESPTMPRKKERQADSKAERKEVKMSPEWGMIWHILPESWSVLRKSADGFRGGNRPIWLPVQRKSVQRIDVWKQEGISKNPFGIAQNQMERKQRNSLRTDRNCASFPACWSLCFCLACRKVPTRGRRGGGGEAGAM